jgi:hypothetical protein
MSNRQTSTQTVLQAQAVANGNGTVAVAEGVNGALQLLVSNGVGTCTLTVQGSFDNFATAQDVQTAAVVKLSDSGAGANVSRAYLSGALAVAANTSYAYSLPDAYPYYRAVVSAAAGLGAGTGVTGCTATLYAVPI